MAYVIARIYSGPAASKVDEISCLTIRELAPKLAEEPGLMRYSTIAFSDGRYGSFSVFQNVDAAKRSTQIATEWVKSTGALQGSKLDETMEGEVGYAVQGSADDDGELYAVGRLYRTDASMDAVRQALQSEGDSTIKAFTGLARYTAAKLADGRIGIFAAFDTQEHARQSSEQAKALRDKAGSKLASVLPSDPPSVSEKLPLG